MGCCEFHDRLDKKLHTHAYGGKICGSLATRIAPVPNNPGVMNIQPDDDGNIVQKSEFCCFECPTLKAKA
jgi:hypothetical protein